MKIGGEVTRIRNDDRDDNIIMMDKIRYNCEAENLKKTDELVCNVLVKTYKSTVEEFNNGKLSQVETKEMNNVSTKEMKEKYGVNINQNFDLMDLSVFDMFKPFSLQQQQDKRFEEEFESVIFSNKS
jgi:hypothetical protein